MLSFIQYLTEVQTNQTFGDGDSTYDVDGIIRRKQIKRANTRRVSDLIGLNGELTNAEGNFHELLRNPTPEFMARVKRADTRFPIHVDTDGNVIDGSHRLAALHFAGERYAKVQVVGSNILAKTRLTEEYSKEYLAVQSASEKYNTPEQVLAALANPLSDVNTTHNAAAHQNSGVVFAAMKHPAKDKTTLHIAAMHHDPGVVVKAFNDELADSRTFHLAQNHPDPSVALALKRHPDSIKHLRNREIVLPPTMRSPNHILGL